MKSITWTEPVEEKPRLPVPPTRCTLLVQRTVYCSPDTILHTVCAAPTAADLVAAMKALPERERSSILSELGADQWEKMAEALQNTDGDLGLVSAAKRIVRERDELRSALTRVTRERDDTLQRLQRLEDQQGDAALELAALEWLLGIKRNPLVLPRDTYRENAVALGWTGLG